MFFFEKYWKLCSNFTSADAAYMCLSALFLAILSLGMPAVVEWKGFGQGEEKEEQGEKHGRRKRKISMGRERRKGLKEESRSELTSANPAVTQSADDPHIKVRLMVWNDPGGSSWIAGWCSTTAVTPLPTPLLYQYFCNTNTNTTAVPLP